MSEISAEETAVNPESWARFIQSALDDGVPAAQMKKEFNLHPRTIPLWLSGQNAPSVILARQVVGFIRRHMEAHPTHH